jgi:threonine/homoserine/homoserine lactone efflux protein
MNLISIFFISFLIALSGALAPGPLLAVVVAESPRRGFKTGPMIILGHTILETIMIGLLLLGFSKLLNNPLITRIIAITGGVILIWFGIKLFIFIPRATLQFKNEKIKSRNLPLLGITMSLANPYWTIWWLTIGWGLLLLAQKTGVKGVMAFFLGHVLADFGWYSTVSWILGTSRKFITLKLYKTILLICGLSLICLGVYFGFKLGI